MRLLVGALLQDPQSCLQLRAVVVADMVAKTAVKKKKAARGEIKAAKIALVCGAAGCGFSQAFQLTSQHVSVTAAWALMPVLAVITILLLIMLCPTPKQPTEPDAAGAIDSSSRPGSQYTTATEVDDWSRPKEH